MPQNTEYLPTVPGALGLSKCNGLYKKKKKNLEQNDHFNNPAGNVQGS